MIRKYKKGDAFRVDVQKEQISEAKECSKFFAEIIAFSLIDEKKRVLAVMGYKIVKDRAECFALLGEKVGLKMIELIKFIKKKMKIEADKNGVKRIFITVKDEFYNAKRMANILGFKEVAKLPLFFDEKDYLLYERKE